MGCCASSLKLKDLQRTFDGNTSASSSKRSRSSNSNSVASDSPNSSGVGSACSTPQRSRSIWSRSQAASALASTSTATTTSTRPICDDFAEQPTQVLERSCGYHTCSSAASTPSKRQLRRTQEMDDNSSNSGSQVSDAAQLGVGNLEWEMFMMQHAQRIMCKTSSPICQRRGLGPTHDVNSRAYHKWRNYLQSTPVHMLHNVTHIPEAIAGQFCPTDFPAFSDLEEMESAAKRYKVDVESSDYRGMQQQRQPRQLQHLTHTISTDL